MPDKQMMQGNFKGLRTTYTVVTMDVPHEVFDLIAGKLRDAGYDHCFMEPKMVDLSGVALVPSDDATPWHLSTDGAALVGSHKFKLIAGSNITKGKKCLLLGPGRTATIGTYDGDPQWTHYFEMPDVPDDYVDPYWASQQSPKGAA